MGKRGLGAKPKLTVVNTEQGPLALRNMRFQPFAASFRGRYPV